ncbi:hypothetical protein [Photobacterium leiognathi]|uniref:hypothetical protein n=1 Tax=Photobacterium leiognathi TaxID=553611 RepID=UPI002981D9B4|nr:hypothetical protein [Photobacterium leiognathi]
MKKISLAKNSFHQIEWNDDSLYAKWGGTKEQFNNFLRKSAKNKKKYLCDLYMENGGDIRNLPFRWMSPFVSKELAIELIKLKKKHYAITPSQDEPKQQPHIFKWPTTFANYGTENLPESQWPKIGMLKAVGYRVGSCGIKKNERIEILKNVYTQYLPLVESEEYIAQWAKPSSAGRLKKMAETLAALIRNAKRKSVDMSVAIRNWEDDLQWLKDRYYEQYQDQWKWPKI